MTETSTRILATGAVYGASPTKRRRRSRSDLEALDQALIEIVRENQPITARGVFYNAVSRGLVEKTEVGNKAVGRRLVALRRSGRMAYGMIADSTRWRRKPPSFTDLEAVLKETAALYRRRLWDEQPCYCELWIEKDTLAGVILPVTGSWDVPLMSCRGYPSLTFLASAAEVMRETAKPVVVLYMGDHDPSGVDIPRFIERELREMATGIDLTFSRLAVLPDQIEAMGLPTRPTKRSDSRSRNFAGGSVELDAIPAPILRSIVEDAISALINHDQLRQLRAIEAGERETLANLASVFGDPR